MRYTNALLAASLLCVSGIVVVASAAPDNADPAARKLIDDYLEAIAKVKDMTYVLSKTERLRDGDVVRETLKIKLRVEPYAVYLAKIKPEKGLEAIYRAGMNDGELTVHQGSFPDVTLNLSPEGSTAMDDQRHSILGTGLASVTKRLNQALVLVAAGKATIRCLPDAVVAGAKTARIEIDAAKAGETTVQAKEDETLHDVARRVGSWAYTLYQRNPDVDSLDDELDAGQKIMVPGYYALRTEFCFDKQSHLVVSEAYFDKKGRFELYETTERKTNVGLKAADFDPDNSAYDF